MLGVAACCNWRPDSTPLRRAEGFTRRMSTSPEPSPATSAQPGFIVCTNRRLGKPSCHGSAIADALEAALHRRGLTMQVQRSVCLGACEQGPNVRIAPGGRFFHQMSIARIDELIAAATCSVSSVAQEANRGQPPA